MRYTWKDFKAKELIILQLAACFIAHLLLCINYKKKELSQESKTKHQSASPSPPPRKLTHKQKNPQKTEMDKLQNKHKIPK